MKLSKNILIAALLVAQALCQETGGAATQPQGGSCKGGCVSCRTNGETEWCLACRKKKHVMSNAIDGKCEGDPIANCEVQFAFGSTQICAMCSEGFGLVKEIVKADATAKTKQHVKATQCKAFATDDPYAVTGEYRKDGRKTTPTEYFYATSCKYGYTPTEIVKSVDETTGGNTARKCQPTTSTQNYDENCLSYTSSGCFRCKGSYVKRDNFDGRCEQLVNNAGGTGSGGDENSPIHFGKLSTSCNTDTGFYWKDGEFKVTSVGSITSSNPSLSGSDYTINTGSDCLNCYGVCTSDDFGTVGDGMGGFSKIITSLMISCLIFLFK